MTEVIEQERTIVLQFENSAEGFKEFIFTWEMEYKHYVISNVYAVHDNKLRATLRKKL